LDLHGGQPKTIANSPRLRLTYENAHIYAKMLSIQFHLTREAYDR
jgi:hypothetical protein